MAATDTLLRVPAQGLSLDLTLDCGQSFRWKRLGPQHWQGIVAGKLLEVWLEEKHMLCKGDISEWELTQYFDLDTDYAPIVALFCRCPTLKKACAYAEGLRILRQDPFEALITFIFSQQNNIPRITGLVERFCTLFGEPIDGERYAFPLLESLCALTLEQLQPLKSGYRAKYILDAAQKVANGTVDLSLVKTLPIHEARQHLMQINGVGIKVAECALLFGFHRLDALPVDVWVGRAMQAFYPNGFDEELMPYCGIAQQYLFHYIRTSEETAQYRPKSGAAGRRANS